MYVGVLADLRLASGYLKKASACGTLGNVCPCPHPLTKMDVKKVYVMI